MEKRLLGRTGMEVSAVGYGAMGLTHAYGAPTDWKEGVYALEAAVDAGYTFFDTAECYTGVNADGSISYNEDLVGAALNPYRNRLVIATKFGVQHSPQGLITDSRPETIRKSLEGSLKRLGMDHVELYYQHRLDPKVPEEEVAGVMSELIREGKILSWGISEVDEENLRKAHAVCPVTAIQNRYSMMARQYESLFPVVEELGVTYVAFSPLANGFLTDKYNETSTFSDKQDYRAWMPQFRPEAYEQNQTLLGLLRQMAEEKNATPAQISMAWMICKKPFIVPIPGSRKVERLRENAGAGSIFLTAAEVALIDKKLDEMEMSGVFGGTPRKAD